MPPQMASYARYDTPDRYIWIYGPGGGVIKVEFWAGHHWTAVECNEWGQFFRRLYDGRED